MDAVVVVVKKHGMKEAWCLAVDGAHLTGPVAVRLYARGFTIEETFRDTKDARYGMGCPRRIFETSAGETGSCWSALWR